MATWSSRGLRGSTLEEFINHTNERYGELGLALVQRILQLSNGTITVKMGKPTAAEINQILMEAMTR